MYIKNISELDKQDIKSAGGKGASLGELVKIGMPVPKGFVILSNTYEEFIKNTKLEFEINSTLQNLKSSDNKEIQNASEKITSLILQTKIPDSIAEEILTAFKELKLKYVAVRSSATAEDSINASWAGQLETYLNTSENDLLQNIKKCWASLYSPRAIFYRLENNLNNHKISIAVIVQEMIQSKVSGITFTIDPVTQDKNKMIIEAVFGLGEAIVSGSVTPDKYDVDKKYNKLINKYISNQTRSIISDESENKWIEIENGDKQKLDDSQIIKVATLAAEIEKHYGFPCDIEWAYANNNFFILQSRPITTLTNESKAISVKEYKKLFSRDFSLPSVEAWVRGESINPKGWTDEKQPFLPYIITERANDTVHFYYDLQGVEWVTDLLSELAHKDGGFINKIGETVLEKLTFIRPIYEKEEPISLPILKKFLIELEAGYPWFEAMWWFFQMDDETKIAGLDLTKLAEVRKHTDKLCNSSDTVTRKSLKKIYPELGELSSLLTIQEIIDEKLPEINILKQRDMKYFYTNNQLFLNANEQELEEEFKIKFINETNNNDRILSGLTAYKGVVRGFEKIVMGHKQIDEVPKGAILISPMTIPDFAPAMKNAAAIVTDEGGMLCHAAIVARELKKPTIVGTEYATKRFKDNDIVEIDADNGEVKLICHAAITARKLKKPCIVGTQFATNMFKDGDYVEVDADRGIITLLNKHDSNIKNDIKWDTLFK